MIQFKERKCPDRQMEGWMEGWTGPIYQEKYYYSQFIAKKD